MLTPYKCPACNGPGLVSVPPYIAGDQSELVSDSSGPWTCKACGCCRVCCPLWSDGDSFIRVYRNLDV